MNDPAPFLRCLFNCYAGGMEEFYLENNIPFQVLIAVDNVLRYALLNYDLHPHIKMIFFTTALTQSMAQGLRTAF